MEIASIFVINKADQPGADRVESELQAMLSMAEGSKPPIIRTVATERTGVSELLEAIRGVRVSALPSGFRPARHTATRVTFDHLGIAVNSIEKAVPFYESVGLHVTHREAITHEKVQVAILPAGDSRIELIEPAAADSPISNFLAKRGPGLHHIAIRVPDLNAALERLRLSGVRLLNEPRQGAGGHLYVFVHPASTGGVLLELIQESAS